MTGRFTLPTGYSISQSIVLRAVALMLEPLESQTDAITDAITQGT
jgi:hypothetical protein